MSRLTSLLTAVLSWLLVAGSVVIITGGLLGRPVLLAAVPTGSMLPVLQPGDMIPVLPIWGDVPRIGDVIVFRTEKDDFWVVHRIISGTPEGGFITKGDNNPVPDANKVLLRHVAGIVPTWRDQPVRAPGLGRLSQSGGSLSSPVVAGAAMLVGVYLLVADAGAGLQSLHRLRLRTRRVRQRQRRVLPVYLGLAAAASINTGLVAWSLSSVQPYQFEVVAEAPSNVKVAWRVVAGVTKVDSLALQNPSVLPLIVAFSADDPQVTFSPSWAVLGARERLEVKMAVRGDVLGKHETRVRQAVYLPLLPVAVLRQVAATGWYVPSLVTALVPALLVLVLACADPRSGMQFRSWAAGLKVRFDL